MSQRRASPSRSGVALAALVAACASPAGADEDLHPLRFSPEADAPVLAAAGFAWLTGNLMQSTIVDAPTCAPCVASNMNALDRPVAGRWDPTADKVSWGLLGAMVAAPLLADGIDVHRSRAGARSFGDDAGVYLEALAIDGAANEILKLAVRRPRPFTYGTAAPADARASSDAYVSFYSEHTSLAFTAAAAWATTFALRHGDSPGAVTLVALSAFALAGTTAALRVVAGKHFPTDVGVGALVGSAVGVATPLLHRRRTRLPAITVAPVEGGAVAFVTFRQ